MNKKDQMYIKNIYYMLSYAYQTLQQQDAVDVEAEAFDNIYDLFAAILAKGIGNQVKRGLSKEYIEKADELSILRGKIDLTSSIRMRTINNKRLVCIYDEFSEDIYVNRILKSVSYALICRTDVKRENKAALKRLMFSFSEVEKIGLSEITWSKLRYYRNNVSYRMLMNICYLTVQGLLLTKDNGNYRLASFEDEQQMHRLYEKFILEYYRKWFPMYKPASKQIPWAVEGEEDFLPVMQSDIMLTDGDKTLIIDAKYYSKVMQKRYDKQTLHSNNMYQIFTYVKNQDRNMTGKAAGMLLYAKLEEDIYLHKDYRISGNKISVRTLDLGTEFKIIAEQLDKIVIDYFE
ncbi:5-methylcytosine-specific restriction endonuclease system specificity protein McrC [Anaerocolumna xylanovorans]|uniref:5-methylcytosine-specific restriction enzyme subunit McrC n=1 Tax=Anaerocolumna xylanovorans DSM 12503 TaxID=1121345 RepID=A0A1M7XYJ6_9FIRM|nr:5-methylcytosine-specific restriction endonuclease system specificity protein McrC [Anaerocolumna xylanovorans]SHO44070.1 5-methylcytosine-specific restriction enzyme subunit McrC [Anaerocolumna xylanovorans DSM 12503]